MPLDSPVLRDGDTGFIGYASRMNPLTLPAGVLQLSENMRLDRGVAVTRKGAKRMADDISITDEPLTVPFILTSPGPVVRSVYTGGILAAGVFRSPDAINSNEIIVLAGSDRAYTLLLDDAQNISGVWASDVIGVDEDGVGGAETELVTNNGDTLVISVLAKEITYPTSPDETIEPTDTVSLVQAFDRLYLLREASPAEVGWGSKNVTTGGITVSGTTATVNLTGHGYPVGARVRIEGSSTAAFDGHEYDITAAPTTDTFEITVPTGTATDATTAGRTVRRVKCPLYWDGVAAGFVRSPGGVPAEGATYKRLRSVGWANYINNRLIIPEGRDQVALSDILDPNLYDPYWQSFRANKGSNDFVVAVHAWVENSALIFCRKSIWLAEIAQFPSTDGSDFSIETAVSRLTLLTDEVGCSARRTIATAGQYVYFLSDAGVYRLDARLDLKLRGDTRPLSDPISDQLENLNASRVANSVGLWFNNRYYLAVPLSGASTNNGCFLYNALNEQWETRDIYGFGIDDFLVATYRNERRLFVANQAGRLFMLDELELGDDAPDKNVTSYVGTVPGKVTTRRYGMGSMSSKRFTRVLADAVLPNTGAITVTANLRNPDKNEVLVPGLANTTGAGNDYSLKLPIRHKAHYAEITIETTAARPEIRTVSVEAAGPSLPPSDTKIAA